MEDLNLAFLQLCAKACLSNGNTLTSATLSMNEALGSEIGHANVLKFFQETNVLTLTAITISAISKLMKQSQYYDRFAAASYLIKEDSNNLG